MGLHIAVVDLFRIYPIVAFVFARMWPSWEAKYPSEESNLK